MLSIYPACFLKEETGYSVIFPDLNVATCGKTFEEAMSMAVDCLAGCIYTYRQDGKPLPAPSSLSDIDPYAVAKELELNLDDENVVVNMVSVDVDSYAKEHFEKSVKKTLTIPAWLNREAIDRGINFSQTLQDALLAKIRNRAEG